MKFFGKFGCCLLLLAAHVHAQIPGDRKWMSVGAIHDWFYNYGSEYEEGFVAEQQYGLQWPAIYKHQDMQAAKGLWIGTTNYTDSKGSFAFKVVHIGPRSQGVGEFFPTKFSMSSKYEPPVVAVDGVPTYSKLIENEAVDPTMKWDRLIDNITNTSIGLTMHRKIIGYSQEYHDNYFIYDYTFTNTGIVDEKGTTRPPVTLTGVYVYLQNRYAINADTRYVFGNATGWGINTLNDARGDAVVASTFFPGNKDNDIRASYAWNGKYPSFSSYDNVGGSIWIPYYDPADTVGRLGSAQFIGMATLHADVSPSNSADDPAQPSTTSFEGSDEDNTKNNSQYNLNQMTSEYGWMSKGHNLPRHVDKVYPSGRNDAGTNDPALGTSGGQSLAFGYGPYTIAPGESVHVVITEAASGLDHDKTISVGRRYKSGQITLAQKNDSVYAGRDSLFKTFRRALANYTANWTIPQPPPPPKAFNVGSGAGKIILDWTPNTDNAGDPAVAKWELWRAIGQYDSAYHKIWEGIANNYNDTTAAFNVGHYYYLVAVGNPSDNNGGGLTPPGALSSSRYYTQTYLPAYRRTPPLKNLAEAKGKIRIVPNPFILGAKGALSFPKQQDKLSFVNIPGTCTIRIYSELGELINTLEHGNTPATQTGSEDYDCTTTSGQVIVSGVYIAVITTPFGEREILKFVVVR